LKSFSYQTSIESCQNFNDNKNNDICDKTFFKKNMILKSLWIFAKITRVVLILIHGPSISCKMYFSFEIFRLLKVLFSKNSLQKMSSLLFKCRLKLQTRQNNLQMIGLTFKCIFLKFKRKKILVWALSIWIFWKWWVWVYLVKNNNQKNLFNQ